MNLILFLSVVLSAAASAMAPCGPDSAPQTLDPGNVSRIQELQNAITEPPPEEESPCKEDLAKKEKNIRIWIDFLDQELDAPAKEENAWAEEILKRKVPVDASQELACELDRDLSELEEFYARVESRKEELEFRLEEISKELLILESEKEIFSHPKQAANLIECRDELLEELHDETEEPSKSDVSHLRKTCLARANATSELWNAVNRMEANPYGIAAGYACVLDPSARIEVKQNLDLAKGIEIAATKLSDSVERYFEKLKEKSQERLPKIAAKRKTLATWKCPDWQDLENGKIEASTRKLLETSEEFGTGFVLSGAKGKPELFSARHVGFTGPGNQPTNLRVAGSGAEKQPRHGIEFEVKPGLYDRGRDLIKRPLPFARSTLRAVASGTVIQPGEKAHLFGYPANRDGKFTSHGCQVKGIGRNVDDTPNSESYLLYCPGAESHIGGMSGGPVINSAGEVFGVVAGHNPFTNIVVVQPISRAPTGENHFGFQNTFHYENCLEGLSLSRSNRCQIIPGLSYEKSIP